MNQFRVKLDKIRPGERSEPGKKLVFASAASLSPLRAAGDENFDNDPPPCVFAHTSMYCPAHYRALVGLRVTLRHPCKCVITLCITERRNVFECRTVLAVVRGGVVVVPGYGVRWWGTGCGYCTGYWAWPHPLLSLASSTTGPGLINHWAWPH